MKCLGVQVITGIMEDGIIGWEGIAAGALSIVELFVWQCIHLRHLDGSHGIERTVCEGESEASFILI
jgi:hypothetical protein